MVVLIGWIGQVISGAWMMVAGAVGFAARAVGRGARDLEPHHRRDGLGLLTLGLAIVLAGGLWTRMDNAAGHTIRQVVTGGFGSLAFLAPALIALLAWRFLRHPDRNQATRRAALGWVALLLGLTGLLEIAKGAPRPSAGAQVIRQAGGYIGYGVGGPVSRVLTPWVTGLLLALLAVFGLLLITGTTLHRIPERLSGLRRIFGHEVPGAADEGGLEIDEDYEAGTGVRGRGPRGQIAKNVRLRPALEGGERVKPYDTPLLGPGKKARRGGEGGHRRPSRRRGRPDRGARLRLRRGRRARCTGQPGGRDLRGPGPRQACGADRGAGRGAGRWPVRAAHADRCRARRLHPAAHGPAAARVRAQGADPGQ